MEILNKLQTLRRFTKLRKWIPYSNNLLTMHRPPKKILSEPAPGYTIASCFLTCDWHIHEVRCNQILQPSLWLWYRYYVFCDMSLTDTRGILRPNDTGQAS